MKVLDVLKVAPVEQSVIIDVFKNGHLVYSSIMDYVGTVGEALTKMGADKLDYDVSVIKTRQWRDPIDKVDVFSLVIESDIDN